MGSKQSAHELPNWLLHQMAVSVVLDPPYNGPFPARFRAVGARDVWELWLKQHLPMDRYKLLEDSAISPVACVEFIRDLILEVVAPNIIPSLPLAERASYATENARNIGIATAFWARQGSIIECTPALAEMLLHSDLTHELPANLFHLPLPALYFHGLPIRSERTSDIEGSFVFEHRVDNDGLTGARNLTLIPVRRNERDILWIDSMEVSIMDESVPLVDWIKQRTSNDWSVLLEGIAKVLIYIGLKDSRQQRQTPYSDASRNFSGLSKRKRTLRQEEIERLYDRILLGPDSFRSPR